MALSNPTLGTAVSSTSSGSTATIVTGSISPSSDSFLFIAGIFDGSGTETITVTTTLANVGSWTTTLRTLTSPANGSIAFFAYALVTGAPGTGTITATFSSADIDAVVMFPGWLTGHDTATPVPQAIVSATNTTSTASATLGSTPTSTSEVLGIIVRQTTTNSAATITPASGFTEAGQSFVWNSTFGFGVEVEVEYKNGSSPPAAVSATALGTITGWAAIAVEVAINTGPHPPGQVTGLTLTATGTTTMRADWTAPGNGGSAITGYEYSLNGGTYTATGSTAVTLTFTGLTAASTPTLQVRAINAIGTGTSSTSASVTLPTFYDDFSGGLGNWTISRWRSMMPDNSGDPSHWLPASDLAALSDLDGQITKLPPNDVFVGTGGKLFIGTGGQNYADTILRCGTQIDLTGTVTITLTLQGAISRPLLGNTHLYVTDVPMNAPSMTGDNSNGPVPQSGFDIRFNYAKQTPDAGVTYYPAPAAFTYNTGTESSQIVDTGHAPAISATAMTTVVCTITHSHLTITANGATWFDAAWTIPAGLTQGWLYIGSHNHASTKYGASDYGLSGHDTDSHNAVFGMISWGGAQITPETTYKVPDNATSHLAGGTFTDSRETGMDLGWDTPITGLVIPSVPAGVTSAKLLLSFKVDNVTNPGPFTVTYALNGNPTRTVSSLTMGSSGSGMMSASVLVTDLLPGSNTINVGITGNTGGFAAFIGNVHLLVESATSRSSRSVYPQAVRRASLR